MSSIALSVEYRRVLCCSTRHTAWLSATSTRALNSRVTRASAVLADPACCHPAGNMIFHQKAIVRISSHKAKTRIRFQPQAALLTAAVAATLGGAVPHLVQFAPWQAVLGGLTLGVATAGKFMLTGRILGISGTIRGFVQNDFAPWRSMFVGGMLLGALLADHFFPGSFDILSQSFMGNALLGGLLVGVGSSMGNGCTSGHGICGNARLSLRSAVYTIVFMATGFATATLLDTASILQLAAAPAAVPAETLSSLPPTMTLLPVAATVVMLALAAAAKLLPKSWGAVVNLATEGVAGLAVALGLAVSGMTRPSKVIAFLSPLHPAWDPSLALVMGGALAVALPAFQSVMRTRWLPKPLLAEKFGLPTNNALDSRLLLGAVLFGAGWGISGICPGPGVVAPLAAPSPPALGYLAALMAGMALEANVIAPAMQRKTMSQAH